MVKTAFITGASRGIGKATAELLNQNGYRVFGTSRHPQGDNGTIRMVQLDVCDDESVKNCVETIYSEAGQIDILINNAGISIFGAVEETSLEESKRVFETNLFGVMRVTNAVLPIMRKQTSGLVINLSSLAGLIGVPYLGIYTASKYALEGYAETLRYEVKALGIDVVLLEPDDIHTDIEEPDTVNLIADYAKSRQWVKDFHTHSMATAPSVNIVAEKIFQIIQTKNPKMRYVVGNHAYVPLLKRLLPSRLGEMFWRRAFNLDEG